MSRNSCIITESISVCLVKQELMNLALWDVAHPCRLVRYCEIGVPVCVLRVQGYTESSNLHPRTSGQTPQAVCVAVFFVNTGWFLYLRSLSWLETLFKQTALPFTVMVIAWLCPILVFCLLWDVCPQEMWCPSERLRWRCRD